MHLAGLRVSLKIVYRVGNPQDVVRCRPIVAPNLGFPRQLLEFEQVIFTTGDRPHHVPSLTPEDLENIAAGHPGERLVTGADDARWRDIAARAVQPLIERGAGD